MKLVQFGSVIVNMDRIISIEFTSNKRAVLNYSDDHGVWLEDADVIALEYWIKDNSENARAPMEVQEA